MNIIVDTGFWFAFYEEKDKYHKKAIEMMPIIEKHHILIPYPSLYETINTRFSKRKKWMSHFHSFIMSSRCTLIHDDNYKRDSLKMTFDSSIERNRPISMVDMIIRQMLDDINLRAEAIVTFNPEDFYDVCTNRGKILISDLII